MRPFILVLLLSTSLATQAQKSPLSAQLPSLKIKEDSLATLCNQIVNGRDAATRFRTDSIFTRTLVRTLVTPYSFYYPLDSLQTISRLYAPDSSFRIITWQVIADEGIIRRHGAIQINTPDGHLKLLPLIDRSNIIDHPTDTIAGNDYWIGNIYYRIIYKKVLAKKYYFLLGYDEHTVRSTKKWIDVLSFDAQGKPVFGAPVFSFAEDRPPHPMQTRFSIEFKKDTRARIQYDEEMDMIIYDHLISESNEPEKNYTLVPDGDYEGFKWKAGRWIHVTKVFNQKLKDGEAPTPTPYYKTPKNATPGKQQP